MENTNKYPLMYGIVDSDGVAYLGENCVASSPQQLFSELNGLNNSPDAGYKIVALGQVYLEDAAPQVAADALAQAQKDAQSWADAEFADAKSLGAGGPGELKRSAAAESKAKASIAALAALAAAPVQAQEPANSTMTNKEIELAIALGKAQGTLRFIAAVSKDKHIADKALEAATPSPSVAPVQPVAVPDGGRNAALDEAAELVLSCHQKANRRGIATAIRMLKAAPTATPAAQGDAKDAERWRFMMAIAENEEGPEAKAIELLGNDLMDKDESNAKQMIELVDAAIAAIAAKAAS